MPIEYVDYIDPRIRPRIAAMFDRHRARQAEMLERYGPVRAPELFESGMPEWIGRVHVWGDRLPVWPGETIAYRTFLPGSFDRALAKKREIIALINHLENAPQGYSTDGSIQVSLDRVGIVCGLKNKRLLELARTKRMQWHGCSISVVGSVTRIEEINGECAGIMECDDFFEIGLCPVVHDEPDWTPVGSGTWFCETAEGLARLVRGE